MQKKLKIGVLISGGGTNMQAIVKACEDGEINGEIVFVGADNPDAKGLDWAMSRKLYNFSVNYKTKNHLDLARDNNAWSLLNDVCLKSKFVHNMFGGNNDKRMKYLWHKICFEKELLEEIEKHDIDLLVLAGYMQICTSYFIDRINKDKKLPRIMNIHPALLPSFPGENGYEDTFNYGCKVGGCTVHFIDYGEDTGPVIGQKSFDIFPGDTLDNVKKRGLALEYELYPECIQLFAEDRLMIDKVKQLDKTWRKIVSIAEIHNSPCGIA
jgi:phosphoribosylglycinamide formyltransferase 1